MIIAHLPSGYILGKTLQKAFKRCPQRWKQGLLWATLFGAIAPDLDLFWFYWIDNRQHHHHSYWTHWPIVWISLLTLASVLYNTHPSRYTLAFLGFSLAGVVHVLLDSVVGDVWWLMPWIDQAYVLFTVPAIYSHWLLNFILHWSFLFELVIWAMAIGLWKSTHSKYQPTPQS